ncbi:hypothetical protein V8Z74_15010 [Comamonas sp. w2-DMI]|uniref:hypothetical protein n=1 Tax=Comamonas sp. w2-DMI TaxID=3126391 RepID=UPI0032E42782
MKITQIVDKKKFFVALFIGMAALNAHAVTIDTGFITNIGCAIYEYLTGSLAAWGFAVMIAAALVVGFFTSMDWGRVITIVAVFAFIQSLGMLIVENPTAAKYLKTASCLRSV